MQIQLNKHSFLKFHGCRVVVVLWDMRKNWFPCFRSHDNCMSYKFVNILWKWCRFDALWLKVFAGIRTNHTPHGQRYIDRFLRLLLPFCSQIVYSCNRRVSQHVYLQPRFPPPYTRPAHRRCLGKSQKYGGANRIGRHIKKSPVCGRESSSKLFG